MGNDVHRCLVLLRARDGSTRADTQRALEDAASSAQQGRPSTVTVRTAMEIENDPFAEGSAEAPFVAALDVSTTHGAQALFDALACVDKNLTGSFDVARSTAVAGVEHTIDPGDGHLGFLFCMKPKPGMTVDEFHHYWLSVHAPNHAHRSGLGYRQLHGDAKLTGDASMMLGLTDLGYRGIADVVLESVPGRTDREPTRGDRVNFVDEVGEVGMVVARLT
jgi:hypothetical protein